MIDRISFLCIEDGRLLGARSKGKDIYYIPGGKREEGETDLEALTREVREELSVEVIPESAELFGIFEAQAHGKPDGTIVQMRCYTARYTGTLTPSSEILDLCWLTMADHDTRPEADVKIFDELYRRGMIR